MIGFNRVWNQLGLQKPTQEPPKIHPKSYDLFELIFRCLVDVASILEAKLAWKSIKNASKNRSKRQSMSSSILASICDCFLMEIGCNSALPTQQKPWKTNCLIQGFWYNGHFVLMSCWPHFLTDVWRSPDPKTYYLFIQKSMKNLSKNQSTTWCNFGSILGRLWADFRGQVGPKLDKNSTQKWTKNPLIFWSLFWSEFHPSGQDFRANLAPNRIS